MVDRDEFEVPVADVRFSTRWIKDRETDTSNPLSTIQFRELIDSIEDGILTGQRKRIFKVADQINLNPEIIKGVIARLETIYLFGIDADLNGRLFETFLTATMRGKDLGQFFTPRSIVKLGTKLADIQANKTHIDLVVDGCCGTGGFLIDALADMWRTIDNNASLSKSEKNHLKHIVATQKIFGVDVGREPNMARLARMNMYLHGDGGSSIFEADMLDKELLEQPNDSPEVKAEKHQLANIIIDRNEMLADIVLTNPPFAKSYGRSTSTEARILDNYYLGTDNTGSRIKLRSNLRSNLMFFERYHDLLNPSGRIVSVIDDGILSGSDYKWFRDFLRQRFIVRAVISLPGDAFQRSQARVKTSL
ncbi:MAG: HsdM family class I SAM-dependent methyltransferase, partial [Rhabdochlamydiaceae bacterium]